MTEPALRPEVEGITATPAPESAESLHPTPRQAEAVPSVAIPRPGRLTALRIALWGGVGGGLGMMAWQFSCCYDEKEGGLLLWAGEEWLGFFLAIAAMLFWKIRIELNLEARLLGQSPSAHAHHPGGAKRTATAALLALIVVFAVEMVVELVHGPLRHSPLVFANTILIGVLSCGGITYFWVRGTRGTLLRAALTGFLSALVISYVALVFFTAAGSGIANRRVWQILFSPAWQINVALLNSLEWAFFGLVGAIAIQQKWGPRPSMSILVGVALVDLVLSTAGWAYFGRAFMTQQQQRLIIPFLNFLRTGGWALALYVCPYADAVLDGSPMERSRRSTMLFRGAVLAAALLFVVLAIARIQVGLPAPQQSSSAPAKAGHDSHHKP